MREPRQQGFEGQGVQVELAAASARRRQIDPVHKDPNIAQEQRNAGMRNNRRVG